MRNLLQETIGIEELRATFAACRPIPLLPPRGDARWQECAARPATQTLLAAILPRAQAEAGQPLPLLSDELYREYQRSGNRLKFESIYFERRRRLARAVFCALFAPDAPSWWPVVLGAWDEIFAEESWALPAHVRDSSGRDADTIDLFAAETANLMAELLTVFAAEVDDARREKICARLRNQFFVNYVEHPERHRWLQFAHNWNAVCHQGVLGAALGIESDADLLARMWAQAAPSLRTFLSGFTGDGGCTEGPGYWNYGFGWFAVLNEQLETRTHGALSLIADDPAVAEIARFGRRTLLTPHHVACFADGTPDDVARPSLFAYLGERLNDAGNIEEARIQYAILSENSPNLDELRADTFYLLRTVLYAPSEHTPFRAEARQNVYLPSLAWWISHGCDGEGTRWALAAKAGHNAEHHNHNDCGSFMLLLNGQPVLDEIGAPQYERDFFSSKRYQFLAARTLGHSLPIINGCEQHAGAEFAARVLKADFGSDFDEFWADLTACYPPEAQCRRFVRTWRVQREPFQVELRDEFELNEVVPIECALITNGQVEVQDEAVVIRAGTQSLRIEATGGDSHFLRCEEPTYMRRGSETPSAVRRLVFAPEVSGLKAELKLYFKAASA